MLPCRCRRSQARGSVPPFDGRTPQIYKQSRVIHLFVNAFSLASSKNVNRSRRASPVVPGEAGSQLRLCGRAASRGLRQNGSLQGWEGGTSATGGAAALRLGVAAPRQVRHHGWLRMAPSGIRRSPNWASGRMWWHFRHMRVISTSLPSPSKMDAGRRRRGLASPRAGASGFPAPGSIAGVTL